MDRRRAPSAGTELDIRELAAALRRRWWLVVGLPALVAVLSALAARPPAPVYQARLSFAVDIPRAAIVPGSDEGTAAKIGEALIDDLSRIISGDVFAAAVAAQLPDGAAVGAGEIASSLSATDRHRVADVTVTRSAPPGASPVQLSDLEAELLAVSRAVVTELELNGTDWFARLGKDEVELTVTDGPKAGRLPEPLRSRLELPLRTALALVVAVGLSVGAHALDPRLHTAADAGAVAGAPVLGRIPARRSGWPR